MAEQKKVKDNPKASRALSGEFEGKYITCAGVVTFAALAKRFKRKDTKRPDDEGGFFLTIAVPPDHDIDVLRDAAEEIAVEEWGQKGKKKKMPFAKTVDKIEFIKDAEGDEVDLDEWTTISASTYQESPVVRDAWGNKMKPEEINKASRNGAWARMIVKPAHYSNESDGVKFYLDSVQIMTSSAWPAYTTPKSGAGASSSDGEAFAAVASDKEKPKAASKRRGDDDEDDERSSRKSKRRDDDDADDDRSTRKSKRRDDDEDDDRSSRKASSRRRETRDDDDDV